jgi:HK97 family phage major capsid protein
MQKLALVSAAALAATIGSMTAAERAKGRYMRAPDHDGGTGGGKTPEELATEVKADFEKKFGEVKSAAEELKGRLDKSDGEYKSFTEKFDEAFISFNEVKEKLTEVEQKMARQSREMPGEYKSLGDTVTESEDFKSFLQRTGKGRVSIEVTADKIEEQKAIISALTTNAAGSVGGAIVPQRLPGVVGIANRPLRVRDLLTAGRTANNAIQFVQETAFTNAAATVSETAGTTKPQSDLQLNVVTSNVTTVAHWVQATRQILDDLPMLRSYIDGRLMYGLGYVEDNQLLNGAGTGTDLNGVYTQATASTANLAVIVSPTKIDVLRVAILQATLANLPATGIVLHPTDWMTIETAKDSQARYLVGDPQNRVGARLWGLPVVETLAMTSGKFLTGAFQGGAQIFDRQDAAVEISTEDGTNFVKNLVTILCEERLALAVYNTLAFVKGDFAAQITDLTS